MCVVDPTEDLKNKRILDSRRRKLRHDLSEHSRQTGRSKPDLVSQSLTKDEIAETIQLFLERVTPDEETGSIFPSPEAEVKDEPQDVTVRPMPVHDRHSSFMA